MAIFIALFFQVIFVFFAMAINVGLVIHDKVNLQNSVDLAAYYGAAKQAEVLNQIAHINYQMRQNYKLFAWRYRVLGTMGNRNHPLNYLQVESGQQGLRPNEDSSGVITPSVCVVHSFFQESKDLDPQAATPCLDNAQQIPPLDPIPVPGGLIGLAGVILPTFEFIQQNLINFCLESGILNWLYTSRILAHFRIDGLVRKNKILRLANNLSLPDPLDLRNESISEGARNTFLNNLTITNRGSIDNGSGQFRYFNSLADGGQCSSPAFWLPEVRINPVIAFSDWQANPASGCPPAESVPNRQNTGRPGAGPSGYDNLPYAFTQAPFAPRAQSTQALQEYWAGEPNDEYHSSIGYEKNPWCMIYSGVEATTVVRKPFDPTGQGVTLRARGYAKPFGGRMGPWYGRTWPSGSPNSQANSRTEMVDPLLPSRDVPGGSGAFQPEGDIVNYSRYPGDEFGIASMEGLSAMLPAIYQAFGHRGRDFNSPIAVANYDHLGQRDDLETNGDSLAKNGRTVGREVLPAQRPFEIAAVAPDIFDALYYSIEPKYYLNYFSQNTTNEGAQFEGREKIYDFGSTKQDDPPGTTPDFSVLDQVRVAREAYEQGERPAYSQDYMPIIKEWPHLLTSWHQEDAVDYGIAPEKFGACQAPVANTQFPTTGNCIAGGRTGYGVKLISRDYLISSEHQLGGAGLTGPILNPPQ